ncbi:hypothetical protein DOY81_014246, partial [Sarcophaga bullata]
EDIQRNDRHCWIGDRIGDYTQLVMTAGIDTQRYNPEVPLEPNAQPTKLNELVDKLLKIRKNIVTAIPSTTRTINDIQSDMAGHDDEGSGRMTDDVDDEEYNIQGSGDGSGGGQSPLPFDPRAEGNANDNEVVPAVQPGNTSNTIHLSLTALYCLLVIQVLTTIRNFKFY